MEVPHGDTFESVTIQFANASFSLLTVVYRPQSTSTAKRLTDFSDMLSTLFLYKRPLLITGDFNFHVDDNLDKMHNHFLKCVILSAYRNTCEKRDSAYGSEAFSNEI